MPDLIKVMRPVQYLQVPVALNCYAILLIPVLELLLLILVYLIPSFNPLFLELEVC